MQVQEVQEVPLGGSRSASERCADVQEVQEVPREAGRPALPFPFLTKTSDPGLAQHKRLCKIDTKYECQNIFFLLREAKKNSKCELFLNCP